MMQEKSLLELSHRTVPRITQIRNSCSTSPVGFYYYTGYVDSDNKGTQHVFLNQLETTGRVVINYVMQGDTGTFQKETLTEKPEGATDIYANCIQVAAAPTP